MTSTGFGSTTSNLPIDIELPGYRLRRPIGADAIGLWFDAEQESLGRKLTVKVLRPEHEHNEAARRELLAEMDRVTELEHPNLIRILDSVRGEHPAIITERIGRQTLAKLLEPGKPMGPKASLHYAHCVARAQQYLLGKGLVHKNVSPGLVNLQEDGGCRLVTFRNVIAFDELGSFKGKLVSDANYIAPEQVGGPRPVGPTAICYQVAALLFHMLAGRPPHRRGTPAETAKAHFTEPFPSLKSAQPFLAKGIYGFMRACTVRKPELRAPLDEVVEALAVLKAGRDPGLEPLPDPEERGRKKIVAPRPRRRRRRRR